MNRYFEKQLQTNEPLTVEKLNVINSHRQQDGHTLWDIDRVGKILLFYIVQHVVNDTTDKLLNCYKLQMCQVWSDDVETINQQYDFVRMCFTDQSIPIFKIKEQS